MFALLAAALALSPPHFRAAPGWHVGSTRPQACVGVSRKRCVQAEAWASTISYHDCPNCVPPHRTLVKLPADGIVIQVTYARERPERVLPGAWPPQLRAVNVLRGPFDGVPARIGMIERAARSAGVEHLLYVWFGRPHPTARQLERANAELRTAR